MRVLYTGGAGYIGSPVHIDIPRDAIIQTAVPWEQSRHLAAKR